MVILGGEKSKKDPLGKGYPWFTFASMVKLSTKCVPPQPVVYVLSFFMSAVDFPVAACEDDSKARSLSK